jgi:hypothetical protein
MSDSAEKTHSQSPDLSLSQVVARIEDLRDGYKQKIREGSADGYWNHLQDTVDLLDACLTLLRQPQAQIVEAKPSYRYAEIQERQEPQAQGWQPEDVRTVLRLAEEANKDWRWALDQLPLPSPPAGSQ